MDKIWMKSWPPDVPEKLAFEHGPRPIHEYLRLRAEQMPDKAAVIFYGSRISFKELDQASDRFAAYLLEQGAVKGDRIGIFMGNCPQYVIAHFGAQKIGAMVCPCSPLFKEMELTHELNDAGVKILVAWDVLMPVAAGALPKTGVKTVVVTNLNDYLPETPELPLPPVMKVPKQPIAGTVDFTEILARDYPALPAVSLDIMTDVGLLQYTGGTTGLPKGCMLTYYAALFKTATVAAVTGLNPNTICLVTMPIFHIAGMLAGMNSCLYAGATQVLLTVFDPQTAMMAIDRYKVDFWYSAVPMNVAIMAQPSLADHDLSSLKLCVTSSFGIQLTEEISANWAKVSHGGLLIEGAYGLSESHTADTFMPRHKIKYGTCGIPAYQQQFKIVDPKDAQKELPLGEPGEIALKNPAVFKGYWNHPEATRSTLIDGWLYTGDIGKFDADGYLYLLGRKKEMIKVSGYSVFPEEVELMLNQHPEVAQSAVIGVPDPQKGEVVKAFIVPTPGDKPSAAAIQAWAKENMSYYKYPVYVEFRESLPTLGTGKLLRRVLKDTPDQA
jgi:long-chain acyl-CoA synthetase